jgi:hypothetical protein
MKSLTILHNGCYEPLMEFTEGDNFIYEFSWETSLTKLEEKGIKCQRVGWPILEKITSNVMVDGHITRTEFFDLVNNKKINDLYITHKSIKDLMEQDNDDVYLYIKKYYPENLI